MAWKRLRGWEFELESGRVQQPKIGKALEKAGPGVPQSSVANKLLSLWLKGSLSAALVRELADCAIQDGACCEDLVAWP